MSNPLNISLTRGSEEQIIGITNSSILDLDKDIQPIILANYIKVNFVRVITSRCNLKGLDILLNVDDVILPKNDIIKLCKNKEFDALKMYIENCFMVLFYTLDIQLKNGQIQEINNALYRIIDRITV